MDDRAGPGAAKLFVKSQNQENSTEYSSRLKTRNMIHNTEDSSLIQDEASHLKGSCYQEEHLVPESPQELLFA